MKRISINRGLFALVDDEDYERVKNFCWFALRGKNCWYAARNTSDGKGQYMHRLVLRAKHGELVDHKDRNGLNNQKKNLRKCTYGQNGANKGLRADSRSGFKGVRQKGRLFQAYIGFRKKWIHLGYYGRAIDAARAYNVAAKKYYGEFARPNGLQQP